MLVLTLGRVVVALEMLAAAVVIPLALGSFAQALQDARDARDRGDSATLLCARCALAGHEKDAVYCRRCGERLPKRARRRRWGRRRRAWHRQEERASSGERRASEKSERAAAKSERAAASGERRQTGRGRRGEADESGAMDGGGYDDGCGV